MRRTQVARGSGQGTLELLLVRQLWGVDLGLEVALPRIKALGYDAVECPLPEPGERPRFAELLRAHELSFIPQIFTSGASVEAHLETFEAGVRDAAAFNPILINSQSGSDTFSREECFRFFEAALAAEHRLAAAIAHETHRGRILYNPWIGRDLLQSFAGLKLTCDYSHWVCVANRLLESELPILELCAEHAVHIHARVGFENGPQVADPRAPEVQPHLAAHEAWWRMIWLSQKRRGLARSSLTPEFGPPPYMPTLPFTRAPLADVWDVSNWIAARQRDNFAALMRELR